MHSTPRVFTKSQVCKKRNGIGPPGFLNSIDPVVSLSQSEA